MRILDERIPNAMRGMHVIFHFTRSYPHFLSRANLQFQALDFWGLTLCRSLYHPGSVHRNGSSKDRLVFIRITQTSPDSTNPQCNLEDAQFYPHYPNFARLDESPMQSGRCTIQSAVLIRVHIVLAGSILQLQRGCVQLSNSEWLGATGHS